MNVMMKEPVEEDAGTEFNWGSPVLVLRAIDASFKVGEVIDQ
jgi:hypothetical protein